MCRLDINNINWLYFTSLQCIKIRLKLLFMSSKILKWAFNFITIWPAKETYLCYFRVLKVNFRWNDCVVRVQQFSKWNLSHFDYFFVTKLPKLHFVKIYFISFLCIWITVEKQHYFKIIYYKKHVNCPCVCGLHAIIQGDLTYKAIMSM